jgi:predicted P-loop ATPase
MEKEETNNDLPENLGLNQEVEAFLNKHLTFRYNIITGKTESKFLKSNVYHELDDYKMNSLLRLLLINNIRCSITKLRSLLYSNFVTQYNPIQVYLEGLPSIDESRDYISELAQTVETPNQDLWIKYFKMWMVAWAASLSDETVINHTVIVLNGEQGIGKSQWLSKLVPPSLNKYVFAGTINPENKDTLIHLSETMLIILDEFENMNRNQIGGIKELITKEKIKIRRPYGYSSENLQRRASFVASVNQNEFLTDVTGNRRFLCFEASRINYEHKIEMHMVFAQALFLFKSGFRFWLNKADIEEINKSNEKFRSLSIEEEALLSYYDVCAADDNATYMTDTEILSSLAVEMKFPINQGAKKRLGAALAKCKFIRAKKKGRAVYAVKEKSTYLASCFIKDLTKSEDAA